MINPQLVEDAFKTKPFPASSSVAPIPTVIPNLPHCEKVGATGARTLWVIFAVMLLSTLTFGALAWRQPVQKRLFHILTTFITAISTLAYFAMATGAGTSFAHHLATESHKHHIPDTTEHVYRQVFWAHFVDWALTTPLILLNLAFLSGLSGSNIIVALFANVTMVLTALFFAFAHAAGQRWAWYTMSLLAYLVVVYQLTVPARRAVAGRDRKVSSLYASIGSYIVLLWALYAIVWAIGIGARKWSVSVDIVALAVIDLLAKPIFGFWLLFAYSKYIPSLDGFWTNGLNSEGAVRLEDDEAA